MQKNKVKWELIVMLVIALMIMGALINVVWSAWYEEGEKAEIIQKLKTNTRYWNWDKRYPLVQEYYNSANPGIDYTTDTDKNGKPYIWQYDKDNISINWSTWEIGQHAGFTWYTDRMYYIYQGLNNCLGPTLRYAGEVGDAKKLVEESGKYIYDYYGADLQQVYNKNMYCGQQGQHLFRTGEWELQYKIKIKGDQVTEAWKKGTKGKQEMTKNTGPDAQKANRIIVEVIRRAKLYEKTEEGLNSRKRGIGHVWTIDHYQHVMWRRLCAWKIAIFGDNPDQIPEVGPVNEGGGGDEYNSTHYDKESMDAGVTISNDIISQAENSNITCGSAYIDKTNDKNQLKAIANGANTILGPFQYTFNGTMDAIDVSYAEKSDYEANKTIGTFVGGSFTSKNISNIANEEEFYIQVPTANLAKYKKIWVKVTVKTGKVPDETAIYIFINANQQPVVVTDQTYKESSATHIDDYTYDITIPVTIKKVNADGSTIEGIGFSIYDGDDANIRIGGLVSGQSMELQTNKDYILVERANDAYGYKNANIADATITNGTIQPWTDGTVKFSITNDSVITVKNEPQFGQIKIIKEGESGLKLKDAEFIIWNGYAYLQLFSSSGKVSSIDKSVTINKSNIATGSEYSVDFTSADRKVATRFITNSSGEITIENLEIYSEKGTTYPYTIEEISNNNYGYRGLILTDATVSGAKKESVDSVKRQVKISNISSSSEVRLGNTEELVNIHLKKQEDGKDLSNVEFVVKREGKDPSNTGYLRLNNSTGPITTKDTGIDVKSNTVEYVTDVNQATRFMTNASGNIVINELERYESKGIAYTYKFKEISNSNYGCAGMSLEKTTVKKDATVKDDITNREITINTTGNNPEFTINNKRVLGDIELIKVDEDIPSMVLAGVQFKITKDGKYLQLKDATGTEVKNIAKPVTINKENKANSTEYSVEYIDDASKATIFETGTDGKIVIKNLEVYSGVDAAQKPINCQYVCEEIANPNYGYAIGPDIKVTLTPGILNKITAPNRQRYVKLTGYVWLEKQNIDKDKEYNLRYIDGTGSVDKKLKDLYKYEGGKLVINPEAEIPVEIKLIQKSTGAEVKAKPDEFDSEGKYTFIDVETAYLSDYEIQFVYDGFYYTTINAIIFEDDGSMAEDTSKAVEDPDYRKALNDKFEEINKEGLTSVDGKTYTVDYEKVGDKSNLKGFGFDTKVKANTTLASYDIDATYKVLKAKGLADSIDYINLGIFEKDQPSILISSDINNVLVTLEGKSYNYDYELRRDYRERHDDDEVGVKFEEKKVTRYTRTMYASDIEAIKKDEHKPIEVLITYKITLSNLSSTLEGRPSTLKVNPVQLKNYFDNRYTVVAVSHKLDGYQASKTEEKYDYVGTDTTKATVDGSSDTVDFKTITIDYDKWLEPGKTDSLYITFNVERSAIVQLLEEKSTYHNATEITKYKTAYGDTTGKQNGKYIITDHTKEGEIYAGINAGSAPDNIELKLKDHESGDGTKIFETSGYELDTTSSPSLVLEASDTARQLAGSIWEDTDDNTSDNERLGNGKKDTNEKPIANVIVSLHKINEDGTISEEPAMYSDGITKAETRTDQEGNYTFGYVKEDAETKKEGYIGVLPGNYVVKYTYNGESYIYDAGTGNNTSIDANDYKSTIIKSTVIENAIKKNDITFNGVIYPTQKWYLIQEADRYSDAVDDITLRKDLNNDTVNNKIYNEKLKPTETMYAYTPAMDIGIEYTKDNSTEAVKLDSTGEVEIITFVNNWENVDFGIIKRPIIDINIEKEITGMQIVAQNGGNIVPKGNPHDGQMKYVRAVDKLVSAEIDPKLLQGAKLNEEYTITVTRNCEEDYLTNDYYIYGREKTNLRDSKAKLVVDYLDNSMLLDTEQDNSAWGDEKDRQYLIDNGLIEEGGDVDKDLQSGNYRIYVTNAFESKDEVKLYTTRYLAITTNDIVESNRVEIVELSGGRTIQSSVPGNYVPSNSNPSDPGEPDDSNVRLIITPPTGSTVNNVPYLIAVTVTFTILVLGIVVIKKKIVK